MKAVYYISNNRNWGHVSTCVWDILEEEGFLKEHTGIMFFNQEVMRYTDDKHEYYFVPMDTAVCLDYPKFLPEMNLYFSDFDMSGMVTWHEGINAPENVLTVHSLGDVDSGYFGTAQPRYMRNLILSYEKNRAELGLTDYHVVTEATHWSGVHAGHGNPELLVQYQVPMIDIEVGSSPKCWDNKTACRALARTLTHVFDDDNKTVHNILCVGGIHFDPNFAEAVFTTWGNDAFGVSHIIANQWLVTGQYEEEDGYRKMCNCIHAISGGIEAIFFHDKMKGCYKDLVRRLGQKFCIPIYKHQKLRNPQELEW